jgi:ankyrin repeat protein/L-ascorbate metabolism protein UlaG (beta-lactamase superfamily)
MKISSRLLAAALIVAAFVSSSFAGEIHEAIRQGDFAKVGALAKSDAGLLGAKDTDGSTPLNTAALAANLEMVKLLLDLGADIDAGDNENSNVLHCAAIANSVPIVDYLLARGMNVDVQDANGLTPLSFAVGRRHEEMTAHLLAKGANPNLWTKQGDCALFAAVSRNQPRIVEILLAAGADVNTRNPDGATALFGAFQRNNLEMIKFLLRKGANPNLGYRNGMVPMHVAAWTGNAEALELLLDNGAAVDPRETETGSTPLMSAVERGYCEIADILVGRGADIGVTDLKNGAGLLHVAAVRGYGRVAGLLVRSGADVNARDNDGKAPLFYAVKHGNAAVAKALEAKGAKAEGLKKIESGIASLKKRPGAGEAYVYYLGHAGWAVETKNNVLIFDYYQIGNPADEPSLLNGGIDPAEFDGKKVTVFVSHKHSDHFDKTILGWKGKIADLTYVFGEKPDSAFACELIGPRERRVINGIDVSTIKSTDAGVAFFVAIDGVTIFHAGDHANSQNDLSGPYAPEIDYLAGETRNVDIAFEPVCGCGFPELECVRKGIYYTVDKLHPKVLFPMHSGGGEYRYLEFARDAEANGCKAKICCAKANGDRYVYRKGTVREL